MNAAVVIATAFFVAIPIALLLARCLAKRKANLPPSQRAPNQGNVHERGTIEPGRWYGNNPSQSKTRLDEVMGCPLVYREEFHKLIAMSFCDILDIDNFVSGITYSSNFYSPDLITKGAYAGFVLKVSPVVAAAFFMRVEDGSKPIPDLAHRSKGPAIGNREDTGRLLVAFASGIASDEAYREGGSGALYNAEYAELRDLAPFIIPTRK